MECNGFKTVACKLMVSSGILKSGTIVRKCNTEKKSKRYIKGKSQKLEIYVASKWKLQQHSRAKKRTKLGRYFTIKIVRQNMPFIKEHIKKNMECAICNLQYVGKKTALDWAITGKT